MLKNYFKIALRNLWKNKTFSSINLVGLALGITCSLGIFIIVHRESGYDTFHRDYKNIYRIVCDFHYPEGVEYQSGVPFPLPESFRLDFPQIKKVATIFGGYNNQIDIIDDKNHTSEKRFKIETGVFYTNADFFDIFNFKWLAGNPEKVLSEPNQAALTKSVAEKYFGSWQNAIGKTIRKDNNEILQISGIVENPPLNTDFPLQLVISYKTLLNSDYAKKMMGDWGSVTSREQCYIRLPDNEKAGVIKGLGAFRKNHLDADNNSDFYVLQPLTDIHFNEQYGNFTLHTISKKILLSLSLIGIFLLALACINFINLATAQAVRRSREVGIRKVLGSHRLQLGIQFLGETFIIVVAATLLAVVLLGILSPLTEKFLNKQVSMNPLQSPEVFLFSAAIIFVVTLLSGFYPAIIISGFKPIEALKNKITSGNSASGISLRRVLVVFQFMIAQGLIIATLVIISQVRFFQNSSLGFNKDAIITVDLPRDSVSKTKWDVFREELLQNPGVKDVSLSYTAPASRSNDLTDFRFNQNVKDENFEVNLKAGDEEYLKTYKLQLLAGRFYEPSDTPREAIVNETLLKKERISNYKDALAKYIILGKTTLPIVGVVKDFHQGSLRDPIDPLVIVPRKNSYRIAGIKIGPKNISATIQVIGQLFNKEFPAYLFERNFLDESIEKFYIQEKQLSFLLKLFAAVGIFISCIGLYGLILFMTIQRTKEVGVRKILGASVSNIVMLFFKEFIWLIAIAFVIAASVTWYFMNNWLENFAFHTQISWWMILAVGFASVLLAMITVSSQTIKAAVANPVKSLRTE
jgi:ABC-type antimicrobial peptide transport system permease subunit